MTNSTLGRERTGKSEREGMQLGPGRVAVRGIGWVRARGHERGETTGRANGGRRGTRKGRKMTGGEMERKGLKENRRKYRKLGKWKRRIRTWNMKDIE
jgi:hypothetical protein